MELGVIGVAFLSSWVTLALVTETEPIINEEGEEEYSTKGLIVLGGLYAIRWSFETIKKLFNGRKPEKVVIQEPAKEEEHHNSKHELVI